jgi:hypothetical protein
VLTQLRAMIKSDNFVALLEESLAIFCLLMHLLSSIGQTWFQFPRHCNYNPLPAQVAKMTLDGHASCEEAKYIIKLSETRFNILFGKAHGLLFSLNPCFIAGEDQSTTQMCKI